METDLITNMVAQYGYPALFFALWLGIVGMPIPDEMIVMTAGAITAKGWLLPVPAFIAVYLGVVSGLSLGYVLGYRVGAPILQWLARKLKGETYLKKAENLLNRYGSGAICLSYFFPVVRHVVPYLVGIQRMPLRRYALYSLPTGFVWTLNYFMAGRLFGHHLDTIAKNVQTYGWISLLALGLFAVIYYLIRQRRQAA
ncbi:DedA family protein [Brevibacillus ruminantium]|uniref:DedA family protein n=1 Tax=Brevibacillus ruminantium TaxID=2950604 RepID=A0ABY4WJN5_9BACL|nr:DedA family protein [Brevibacillus ruminantium]USG67089.1 DedA family protein [Brevibacillus ruminantium]